jgi:Co/Zn/Cd efflux system component
MVHLIPQIDPLTGKEINVWLKYVDPILTLIMVIIVAVHAVPVIFSISAVLIENVPDGIDTQKLMNEIITAVPAIKSIHSFHIWRYKCHDSSSSFFCKKKQKLTLSSVLEQLQKKSMRHYILYVTKIPC